MTSNLFDSKQLIASFNRAASTYDQAIALPAEIGKRLIDRLDYIKLEPEVILDVGSATGHLTQALEKRFRKAHVLALDFAANMLHKAKKQTRWHWRSRQHFIGADANQIPLPDQSVDLICSNLLLQWAADLPIVLHEFARVLKPTGLLLFTSLGPDTLQELRQSWARINDQPHVHPFLDMHDFGDALLKAKFADPVVDMEKITLNYSSLAKLTHDLKSLGAHNLTTTRNKSLTSPRQWHQFSQVYESLRTISNQIPATFEIIYGHAWGTPQTDLTTANEAGEAYIPITKIKRKHI